MSNIHCELCRDDASLYSRLEAQKKDALYCAMDKLSKINHNFCSHWKVPEQDRKDILQDAMLALTKIIIKIENGTSKIEPNALTKYLNTVVWNLILELHRKKNKKCKPFESIDDNSSSLLIPSAEYKQKEIEEEINGYLSFLDDNCRKLIRLHRIEGYTLIEIEEQQLMPNKGPLKKNSAACWKELIKIFKKFNSNGDASLN